MNQVTGLKTNHLIRTYKDYVGVWTDRRDAQKLIENVPGVTNVFNTFGDSEYDIYIDPRYDRKIVIQNIQDAIEPKSITDILKDLANMNPLFR